MKEFKTRLEYLKTNSSSKECKDICSTFEGFISGGVNLSEENLTSLLIEKLEKIFVKDSVVTQFISKEKKLGELKESDNLGVLKTIEDIKKSKISQDPTLKYVLESFETEIKKGTPEYLLIEGYIARVSPYKFDSVVSESVNILMAKKERLSIDLIIKESIYYIQANDKNNFFNDVVEKLNNFLIEGNRNIAGLATELKRWAFNPTVNTLIHKLSLMENETTLKVPANNGNCDVTKVYSPVLFNHNGTGDVFVAENNVFKTTKSGLQKLTGEEITALPKKFLTLCEAFFYPGVIMEGENIIFYKGKNKITIGVNEAGNTLTINNKNYDLKNIGNHLYYSGAFNNGDLKEIEVLTTIAEGLDSIFDIDWAKTITSRVFEGAKATVFKWNDKIFINKINPSMHENVLIKANGTQASNLIKSFLKYDISESLTDLLVGEQAKISSLEKERKVILESINKLESELNKIEAAIAENPKIEESKEISEMRDMIAEEINTLKSRWSEIEGSINKLVSIVETDTFSVGDKIKVISDGKTGSVESINDSNNKVNVIMEDGKVIEFIPEAIEKAEDDIEDNIEANEEEGEDFEEEEEKEEEMEFPEGEEEEEGEEEMGEEPEGAEDIDMEGGEEEEGAEGEEMGAEGEEDMEGGEEGEEEMGEEPEGAAEVGGGEELEISGDGGVEGPPAEIEIEEPEGEIEIEEPEMGGEPEGEVEIEAPIEAPVAAAPAPVASAPAPVVSIEQTTADSAADPKMVDVLTDPMNPTEGEEETIYTYNEEPEAPLAPAPEVGAAPVGEAPIEEIPAEEIPAGEVEEDEDYEEEIGSSEEEGGEPSFEPGAEGEGEEDAEGSDDIEFDDDAEGEEGGEEMDAEGEEEEVTLDTINTKLEDVAAKLDQVINPEGEEEEGIEGEEEESFDDGEGSEEELSDDDLANAEDEEGTEPEEDVTEEGISEGQKHYDPKGKETKASKIANKVKKEAEEKKKAKTAKGKEKTKAEKAKENLAKAKKAEKKSPIKKK